MLKIKLREKDKFVIIIGDEGAVLTYFVGKKLVSKLFALSSSNNDRKEFDALFAKHPNAPIYVLIDGMEQSYSKQILPAVSVLSIGKLVKKRLERDFSANDIKGALLLGRSESGRKDWIYIFASVPINENFSKWIEYLSSLPNELVGIYMLSIEMSLFMRALNKELFKAELGNAQSDWQILVTHNKTGGFRQIVSHKKQVVFTRMVRSGNETVADIIAGNIEQEILNTVDYLRRLSFGDGDNIDVVVIVAEDIKKSMKDISVCGRNIIPLSPIEACQKLTLTDIASESDKFADLVLAAYFVSTKPLLKFFTPETKKISNLTKLYNLSFLFTLLFMIISLPYAGTLAFQMFKNYSDLNNMQKEKLAIEAKWKEAQGTYKYNLDDADKITSSIALYNLLSYVGEEPLEMVKSISKVQQSNAEVSSLSWTYQPQDKIVLPAPGATPNSDSAVSTAGDVFMAIVNFKFYNLGNNIDQLFQNFDQFSTNINNVFSKYDIDHTKLPDQISFGEQSGDLDIQLTLKNK